MIELMELFIYCAYDAVLISLYKYYIQRFCNCVLVDKHGECVYAVLERYSDLLRFLFVISAAKSLQFHWVRASIV